MHACLCFSLLCQDSISGIARLLKPGVLLLCSGTMLAQKRSVFSLTGDEEGNPQKLVKLCESVPAILKVGDPDTDEDQQMLRSEFKKTINILWRNPG